MSIVRRAALIIEVLLYVLFMVDCFLLLALQGTRDYFPPGGVSLIVLLLLAGIVHKLRTGEPYD